MGWIEKTGTSRSSSTGSGTGGNSTSGGTAVGEEPQWYLRLYFEYIEAVTELVYERERAAADPGGVAAKTSMEAPGIAQPRGGGDAPGGSPAAAAAAFVEQRILSPDEAPMVEKPLSGEAVIAALQPARR